MTPVLIPDERSLHKEDKSIGTSLDAADTLTSCDKSSSTTINRNDVSTPETLSSDNSIAEGATKARALYLKAVLLKCDEVNSNATSGSKSLPKSADQESFSRKTLSWLGPSLTWSISWPSSIQRLGSLQSTLVGPEKEVLPQKPTVVLSLASFCLFLALGGLAARYPKLWVKYAALALSAALLLALTVVVVRDFSRKETRRHPYRRNLGNTVMTVCLSLLIMPLLYNYLWYPNLRQQVLQFSEDVVDHAYFPSVALFQRMDWSSQATLDDVSVEPNCFLGWFDPNAADCNTSEPGTLPCSCNSSWSEDIKDFLWQNVSYRYLNMQATSAMLCNIPTTQMILQAFYWFNSTQEFVDSSWNLSPSLWVAIYDPTLTLQEALENGYTRMVLVNANGMTAINLGLNYRQAFGSAPAYDYELSISTIPAISLVCDLGSTTQVATGPCHISLFLQIPSFTRQTSLLSYAMGWTDVVSNAGAYFSFIQLISWIFSGIAFQT